MENSNELKKAKIPESNLEKVVGGMSRKELLDLWNLKGHIQVRFIDGPFRDEYGDVIALFHPEDPDHVMARVQVFARLTIYTCSPHEFEVHER